MADQSANQPTPEVLARWDKDCGVMKESIKLMLSNRIAEADAMLEEATEEIAGRELDFEGGEHDLRGGFAFVSAIYALLNGLASLENNQLDNALSRTWAADELLTADQDWAGKTVMRGLCILVGGVVQVMQGSYAKGVWNALRSWLYLRNLETEGLNCTGHEAGTVRSTSLFALGVFNLFTSVLPPQQMQRASWVTGFKGGRDTALGQLRQCFDEGGMCSPFGGLILIGFGVDVSNFLGEFEPKRGQRLKEANEILEWSQEHYPNSFFFEGSKANYLAAVRDLDGAIALLKKTSTSIQDKPAFMFLVHVKLATLEACKFNWINAAKSYEAAVEIHKVVGRRAFCPSLLLNAHCCYVLAGDNEEAARVLEQARSYRHEKKKWGPIDVDSLAKAELAHTVATEGEGSEVWRPKLLFLMKVAAVYRGACFMKPEAAKEFISMLQAETDLCGDDLDHRCLGIFLQAETMRQLEKWDEALELVKEGTRLAPSMSAKGKKLGSLHFLYMIEGFAQYAKGNLTAAQGALMKLDALDKDAWFAKQVQFKATYLRELLGVGFQDTYTDIEVGARSKARLLMEVTGDVENVEWDWCLKDKTINFTATYYRSGEGYPAGDPEVLQSVEQHAASSGPLDFSFDVPGPGRIELIFDNSFSMMTGKSLQCRVQPDSLEVKEDLNF